MLRILMHATKPINSRLKWNNDMGVSDQNKPDGIAILDFGGQYCHLIARRVREMRVYTEILSFDADLEQIGSLINVMNLKGIILSGSPASINIQGSPRLSEGVLEIGLPILGLCYGHQLIAYMYGGEVRRGDKREYGITEAIIDIPDGVLKGLNTHEKVWMSHGDTVFNLPNEFQVQAHTATSPVAAFRHSTKPIHGLQWHPEVVHTRRGKEILENFVLSICGCIQIWEPSDSIQKSVQEIRNIVGNSKAIIALSGGVDSSVAAALAAKALGDRLVAVHVDHGLMRMNESDTVEETFTKMGVNLIVARVKERFLKKLKGVIDPEEKRKIIGEEFIRVFEAEARQTGAEYLIQGTIYPDRIESGFRSHSDKIKTHHNVGGLPLDIGFKEIIEPLRDFYKDEVRKLGARLDLPFSIVNRQPFPGPGLAVRIIGEITEEKLESIRQVDAIVCEEVESSELLKNAWQYLAVLTDTMSTGVKGDEREYGTTVAVRIVESVDGMTANFSKAPWSVLERISTRITNSIPGVTRVVYDITHKPPATIEWE
jgi:GMP synthase (glutamine-hydrolysing)